MGRYVTVVLFCVLAAFVVVLLAPASSAQSFCSGTGVCVLTWQNDTYRTGDNLDESTITHGSIQNDNFGQLCLAQLDGQVFAQPLVVTNVTNRPYDLCW